MVRFSDIYKKLSGQSGKSDRPEQPAAKRADMPSAETVGAPEGDLAPIVPGQSGPDASQVEPRDLPERLERAEEPPEPGLSQAERSLLDSLTGQTAPDVPEPAARAPAPERTGKSPETPVAAPSLQPVATSPQPPTAGQLTPQELEVRQDAISESERITREELPRIFPAPEPSIVASMAGQLSASPRGESAAPVAQVPAHGAVGRLLGILTVPERLLGPVVLTGLGLGGIFLLIALLVVVLIRQLSG